MYILYSTQATAINSCLSKVYLEKIYIQDSQCQIIESADCGRLLNKVTAGLFQTLHNLKALDQGLANFFCKRSVKDSKYFRLCGPCGLCLALPSEQESSHKQSVNELTWPSSNNWLEMPFLVDRVWKIQRDFVSECVYFWNL